MCPSDNAASHNVSCNYTTLRAVCYTFMVVHFLSVKVFTLLRKEENLKLDHRIKYFFLYILKLSTLVNLDSMDATVSTTAVAG